MQVGSNSMEVKSVSSTRNYDPGDSAFVLQKEIKSEDNSLGSLQIIFNCQDVVNCIFELLSFKDFMRLDATTKSFEQHTKRVWKLLKSQKDYNYDWLCLQSEPAKDKYTYILNRAIDLYIHDRSKLQLGRYKDQDKVDILVQQLWNRYSLILERFPNFGAYVWDDLSMMSPTLQIEDNVRGIFEKHIPNLKLPMNFPPDKNISRQLGGEFLLQGLFLTNVCRIFQEKNILEQEKTLSQGAVNYDEKEHIELQVIANKEIMSHYHRMIFQCFNKAIEKGATCTLLYSWILGNGHVTFPTCNLPPNYYLRLEQSIEKHNEFRLHFDLFVLHGLDLNPAETNCLISAGKAYLIAIGNIKKNQNDEALQFISFASQQLDYHIAYNGEDSIPLSMHLLIAYTKSFFKPPNGSDVYFEKILNEIQKFCFKNNYNVDEKLEDILNYEAADDDLKWFVEGQKFRIWKKFNPEYEESDLEDAPCLAYLVYGQILEQKDEIEKSEQLYLSGIRAFGAFFNAFRFSYRFPSLIGLAHQVEEKYGVEVEYDVEEESDLEG